MITKENLQEVLRILGFKETKKGIWTKQWESSKHYATSITPPPPTMQVDFTREKLIYPQDLLVESDSVTGFTTIDGKARNENFVVFECVHRLLEQGYKPEDLVLEKTWRLGGTSKSGRADITIHKKAEDTKEKLVYAIIECKTAADKGKKESEYTKAKKDLQTNPEGNQLFSYAAQARSVEWLCLYASDYDERAQSLSYQDEIIKFKDDENILNLAKEDSSIQTFSKASESSDFFSTWEETYNKQSYHDLIFKSQAYNIGIPPLYKKDLKPFDKNDGLNVKFKEILRHNNASNRNTAFDVLLAVFLAKCYDEQSKSDNEELDFYYNPLGDDYFRLYKRLKSLFIAAMKQFLKEDVFYIKDDLVAKTFQDYFHTNRKRAQEILEDAIQQAQNYSAQFFAFKKVYNRRLFNQNGKILVEVVQLFENYRFSYSSKNQFIGELFEDFLNEGFTQNEGIYFTPTPITRFIWNALPFEDFINLRYKKFPKVIDFACGAGHFLTEGVSAISDYCKTHKLEIEDKDISSHFYGIDKDDRLAMTSQVCMFLNGASESKIRFIDGLEYDRDFYGDNQQDFDILVANPPFSVKSFKENLSRKVLKAKEGNIPYKVLEALSLNAKEIENAFVERLTHILKPKALVAIILPSSILSNTDKATILAREIILQNFAIHCICSFGSQTFGTTGTNTAVLFLRRFDEPPKKTLLIQDSIEAIFHSESSEILESLENFADKELLESYVNLQNLSLEDYQAFLQRQRIPQSELFKSYKEAFDEQSEIKKYKDSKAFKALDTNSQEQELEKRFLDFCLHLEQEKLYYFALTYKQHTLIVKAPDDTSEQKRFLGFVINKGKTSNAGLQESEGLLSHKENRNAEDKIAYAIKQSFKGEFYTNEAFDKYVSFAKTCHLLTFDNALFQKTILLNPTRIITGANGHSEVSAEESRNPFANCKYELVKLDEICQFRRGSFPQPYGKQEWYDGANAMPFVQVADIDDNFKLKDKTKQQISKLAQPKSVFVPKNTIVASIQGTIGRVAITQYDCYVDRTIAIFTELSGLLEQQFLVYMLSILFKTKAETARGITLKTITKEEFRHFKIPLPPIEIQKQIVSECEKVEEQHSLITQSIEAYQNLIKAILAKCKISNSLPSVIAPREANSKILHTTDSTPSRHSKSLAEESKSRESTNTESKHAESSKATDLITALLDSIQELESKLLTLTLQGTNADDLNALLHSLPTPPTHGWDRVKIGNYILVSGGNGFPKNYQGNKDSTQTPFIKVSDMNLAENQNAIEISNNYVTQQVIDELSLKIFPKNTIIFPKVGMAIHTNKKRLLNIPCIIDNNIMGVNVIDDKVKELHYKFLFLVFKFYINLSEVASGANPPSISNENFKQIKIPLPPLEAQEKIVSVIERIESKIASIDSSLESLEARKAEILANALNADNERERERENKQSLN